MAHDILIVDDEDDIRMLIAGILEDEGYETREADTSTVALSQVGSRRPSLIILDIWLEGSDLDGMQLLETLQRDHPPVPIVMISGHGSIEMAVQAIKMGAYDFIEKPFKSDRLLVIVSRAIEAARLRRENEELKLRAGAEGELTGKSTAISQLRQAIEKAAPTGSRVLISGSAGSGKEVVARMLHKLSHRTNQPFVVINCATMAPESLELELFGSEAGTTGADNTPARVGLFEQAHAGTLLLDEVGDMPLETQGKIVRALQEQTFVRVGGTQKIHVDVRVVATTTRDLQAEIAKEKFREDLYYRLNVVPLEVPNLAKRREDVPLLVEHFMQQSAQVAGLTPRVIGTDAMASLQGYAWPGNVRQLRNVIDWLLIMTPADSDKPIQVDMLPPEIGAISPSILRQDSNVELLSLPLRDAREEFERQYLSAQVTRFGGNISRTASFVGMERSALHRKLKLLGVHNSAVGVGRTGNGSVEDATSSSA
ncbi:MAG: sigma-54 dependent transcriptional regulator [Alphaproteobacteria bacterium]|nr:sigma-54 dependent transcriptional regulator [Alphaproteobacteria bacterium]